jgi:hypothetical protein
MQLERVVLRLTFGGARDGLIESLPMAPEGALVRLRPCEFYSGFTLCLFRGELVPAGGFQLATAFVLAQLSPQLELCRARQIGDPRSTGLQVLSLAGTSPLRLCSLLG